MKINIYNPLYIITLKNKKDFEEIYERYPQYCITNCLKKNCCKHDRHKNHLFINKAPKPEDIIWKNLEFKIEKNICEYTLRMLSIIGIYLFFLIISTVINIAGDKADILCEKMGDKIHDIFNNEFFIMLVNIGISIALDHLSDWFGDKILDKLDDESNYWSYSDIKFYCILNKSLFKLINQGIIPYATYIFDAKIIKKIMMMIIQI